MARNPNPERISAGFWWFWEEFSAFEPEAELSGIYANKGGYHNYRDNLDSDDYSVEEVANDRRGSDQLAAAIDITLPDSKMRLYSKRLADAYARKDPRLFIDGMPATREFIGTLDSKVVYCYMLTGGIPQGVKSDSGVDWGRDKSHLWHIHISIIRRFAADNRIFEGLLSILKNESLSTWKGDGMAEITQERFNELLFTALNSPALASMQKARPWQYVGGGIDTGKSTLGVLDNIHQLVKAVASTVAQESTNPAELEAALARVDFPTAEENADAVVAALGGVDMDTLADTLRNVLTPEQLAELKTAL